MQNILTPNAGGQVLGDSTINGQQPDKVEGQRDGQVNPNSNIVNPNPNPIASLETQKISQANLNASMRSLRSTSSPSKGIRFENYSSRPDMTKKSDNDILSYIGFEERKPKGIMFDKLAKRNTGYFLGNTLKKCPSVGTYNPKYDAILDKPLIASKIFLIK